MRTALLLVLALLLAHGEATAQQKPRPQLYIVVEDLDQDAAKCGVTKSQLESIAVLTLRNNGIQAVNEDTNPYLYVQATFLPAGGGCVFATRVLVRGLSQLDFAKRPLGAFKARQGSNTVLCEQGQLSTRSRSTVTADLTQVLENLIKLCLGKLDY